MRKTLDEYDERVLIGEIYLPFDRLVKYYGEPDCPECDMPYNFLLVTLPWEARRIARAVDRYHGALPAGAWPNWVLGNHDVNRIATRAGAAQARVAAMLLLTLRGTATMYYGDEIGLENVPVPEKERQDPVGKNIGSGFSRDPSRTPMRWDDSPNAGFTAAKPWLPIGKDYKRVNVAAQSEDPDSLLTLYRRLIELRRSEPALLYGEHQGLETEGDLLAYLREGDERRFLMVLNLGSRSASFEMPDGAEKGVVAIATDRGRDGEEVGGTVELRGNEGVVVALS
jgi:alpha-glucosidase